MLRRGAALTTFAKRQARFRCLRTGYNVVSAGRRWYTSSLSTETSTSDRFDLPHTAPPIVIKGKGKQIDKPHVQEGGDTEKRLKENIQLKEAAKSFEEVGINARLSLQLVNAFSSIRSPTSAQKAILSAVRLENDMIVRAHTGTGKSFALFLALLNKPRLVTQARIDDTPRIEKTRKVASIIVVPTQELAKQYESWAKQLFPRNMHHTLPSVVAVKYRSKSTSIDEHLQQLSSNPPHLLIITATLLNDLLSSAKGQHVMNISSLRTLAFDEGDALLDLPGRFPSNKLIWNHLKHPSDGLQVLNRIMKMRRTFSSGKPIPSMGLERTDDGVTSDMRRVAHQGNDLLRERNRKRVNSGFTLNLAREQYSIERPLQLIVVSATANSVLRHFLGARTGWLRTGLRDQKQETGKWLDLTGLSKGVNKATEVQGKGEHSQSGWALKLPMELKHACVIVDEPIGDGQAENWRELKPKEARSANLSEVEEGENPPVPKDGSINKMDGPFIVTPSQNSTSAFDENLLTCLAFMFASQPVRQGLALIPARWSLMKTKAFLSQLEIPVKLFDEAGKSTSEEEGEQKLYILQASSVRGLDIPGGLSHVFCIGMESVQDAVTYTHLAGRAARIGHDQEGAHTRPVGHVITILRGLNIDQVRQNRRAGNAKMAVVSSSELKMSLIYKRLDLKLQKLDALRYEDVKDSLARAADQTAENSSTFEQIPTVS